MGRDSRSKSKKGRGSGGRGNGNKMFIANVEELQLREDQITQQQKKRFLSFFFLLFSLF